MISTPELTHSLRILQSYRVLQNPLQILGKIISRCKVCSATSRPNIHNEQIKLI